MYGINSFAKLYQNYHRGIPELLFNICQNFLLLQKSRDSTRRKWKKPYLQSKLFSAKMPFSKIQKKILAGEKFTLQMNEV
jgi:hypothetical protein